MTDFFEIDFLSVGSPKSGDAIPLRYRLAGTTGIHVVDAGFQSTGDAVVGHINRYYDQPDWIDHVVVTHPDGDHAGGVGAVLENFAVGRLWMLRPWMYADGLLPRFARFRSEESLRERLREAYPHIARLEEIALGRGVPIVEPFQGAQIGPFHVMAPSRNRYMNLVVESDKTPDAAAEKSIEQVLSERLARLKALGESPKRAAWGEEAFSPQETSVENEMSVVQYGRLAGKHILLTADAGRGTLDEAGAHADAIGLAGVRIDRFQVPHHGSRRNVTSEILNRWLGPIRDTEQSASGSTFSAIISCSEEDPDHPRKAVVRAMIHRGGKVVKTESSSIQTHYNAPQRSGWGPAQPLEYPVEQEA